MFFEVVNETLDAIYEKDPAAKSRLEVCLCYPGFHVFVTHYIGHKLWLSKHRLTARFVSHIGRLFTGIEIHPGAKLGRRLFIDHGMGVVIGETAVVGDDVVLYQGVTLGAGADARMGSVTRDKKRHPTLGNGVVVGSGAEIQGPITVGDNVRVASGSIILKDVPPNSVVVGVPGRIIRRDGMTVENPDPEAEAIKRLSQKVTALEKAIADIKAQSTNTTLAALEKTVENLRDQTSQLVQNGSAQNQNQAVQAEKLNVTHLHNGSNGQSESGAGESGNESEDPIEIFLYGAGI